MISKTMLVELIKEVIRDNPSLINGVDGTRNKDAVKLKGNPGQFAALSQLADLADSQGKHQVARYLSLAVEADSLPNQIIERITQAKNPFNLTEDEFAALIHQLEHVWQAPTHAQMIREILARFSTNYCLKRKN